jgi:peptidoglycan/LPS O-acetylase OafA/YrhL
VGEAGAESGVGFGFGEVWKLYCDSIPVAIVVATAFPILVLLCNTREWKRDAVFRFSWQLYLMSLIMMYLLYEKGFRKPDFNFSWGYMHGLFFLFLGSLWLLIRQTSCGIKAPIRYRKHFLLVFQWLAYAGHLVSGILYFWPILRGGMYY